MSNSHEPAKTIGDRLHELQSREKQIEGALNAISSLLSGDYQKTIEYAERHSIDHKQAEEYRTRARYQHDARYVWPARSKLIKSIITHALEDE